MRSCDQVVSTSGLQQNAPAAADDLSQPLPNAESAETRACWNEIGVQGNATCPELPQVIHCRNCPVYSKVGAQLLDRPLPPEYRRAWTEQFALKKQLAGPARHSALLFRINTEWLALPTPAFQEVAERRPIHSLPHRRQGTVLGLVNVRGELLICVSLGHLLGLALSPLRETAHTTYDRLLVAKWDGYRFVFPADEVRGILRFQTPESQEPPASLAKSQLSYTRGILYSQGRTVGLLDADLLFSSFNRSLT
jgi:chemotaxis-related protein WspD